jgi:hypothetical protein
VHPAKTINHLLHLLHGVIPCKSACTRQGFLFEVFQFFNRKIRRVPKVSESTFEEFRDALQCALAVPQSEGAHSAGAARLDNMLFKPEGSCTSF